MSSFYEQRAVDLQSFLKETDGTVMLDLAVNSSSTNPLKSYGQALEAKRMSARYINIARMLNDDNEISKGEIVWLSCKRLLEGLQKEVY
jgi:hypothetical protein